MKGNKKRRKIVQTEGTESSAGKPLIERSLCHSLFLTILLPTLEKKFKYAKQNYLFGSMCKDEESKKA
jgi:hypothetical protein